jgi:hypothetical protein
MAVTRKLLMDRGEGNFQPKKKKKILKLHKMSRKVISIARPDRQTDRHYDDNTLRQNCRGVKMTVEMPFTTLYTFFLHKTQWVDFIKNYLLSRKC